MWIAVGIAAGMGLAALFLAIRYRMLKNCVRQARQDLAAIMDNPEENRILLIASPSREVERLLRQINRCIEFHQRERIVWQQQERRQQEQIENISHDLRTPLTSMLGYLELVDGSRLSGEDQEALAVVERKSRYLQGLIRDFYDLSRLEQTDTRLGMESVEITRLIRETALSYYPEFEGRHLAVELELPETAVPIRGNQEALERILHNIIQNALRYARSCFRIRVYHAETADGQESGLGGCGQEGRDSGSVGCGQEGRDSGSVGCGQEGRDSGPVGCGQKGRDSGPGGRGQEDGGGREERRGQETGAGDATGKHKVCLDFTNDTEHLTQADIPCLFDRFYTADHARPSGSTGLGLTISRLLAEAMGGSVTARLTERRELRLVFTFQADIAAIGGKGEI